MLPLFNIASKAFENNLVDSVGQAATNPGGLFFDMLPLPLQAALYSPDANAARLGQLLLRYTENPKGMSRALSDPRGNFGMHAGEDLSPVAFISKGRHGKLMKEKIQGYQSNVNKPLMLSDLGNWYPDNMFYAIKKQRDAGNINFSDEAFNELEKIKEAYTTEYDKLAFYGKSTKGLDSKYAKQMQKVIKREGYDHIQYKNDVEVLDKAHPNKSVIIFDPEDVNLLDAYYPFASTIK